MSQTETTPARAVSVHLASSDVPIGNPAGRERAVSFYTLVLTADDPVQQVLRPDPNRVTARVQAGGANVVLTKTKGAGQNATADAAQATPHGMLLPYTNTAPYPLDTTGEVWAAAASYPAQVAVSVITRVTP